MKEKLTLYHLRIYLNFKFISLRRAGQKAGLSYERMRQLITGKYLPSKPELIKQISEAWDIDSIKLTLLFERIRKEYGYEGKEMIKNGIKLEKILKI